MLCQDIGPRDASIMIIGEAPGSQEEIQGIPFVGQSGKLLKSMLASSGINYDRCYVTNIMNQRPPNNNFGYFYEDAKRAVPKESLRKAWEQLGDKIKAVHPKVVICLGDEPLRAVTNLRGIGSWRGCRIDAYGTEVLATYHPAAILRQYSFRVIAEMDLLKARRMSDGINYKKPEIITRPSRGQTLGWLQEAMRLGEGMVAFDIETIGERIRCIGFARLELDGSCTSICIPFMQMSQLSASNFSIAGSKISMGSGDVNYWSAADEEIILEAIANLFEDPYIPKIGQNSIHFDAPIIKREFGIDIQNHSFDLMHAWHVLYPSMLKGLDFISSVLTDHENYWTLHDPMVDDSEWKYNCMDCVVTLEAAIKVKQELREDGLIPLYKDLVHPLSFALLRAEERGVIFDVEEAQKLKVRLQEELDNMLSKMKEMGYDINPNSPKQIKELLYDKLGFPTVYHHKSRKATTDEDALRRLESKYPNEPVLGLIIQYRKTQKLISTYVEPKIDEDGRIRCSYNASGTITGRISSSKTLRGTGMDLHNIPKGYTRGSENTRHLYRAGSNRMFVVGDLKQAEAMVVAWILKSLGDDTLYDYYHDPGFDIHRWMASIIYDIPESEVTKEQRQQGGKLANHSGNYMAGPGVMERRARQEGYQGFDYKFCKQILSKRAKAIPGLKWWWDDVERKVRATRTLTTCFGRRLHFFGRLEGEELRSAVAFEPQSTVGDVCNKMFIELSKSNEFFPVLTTHDEIVLDVPADKTNEAARLMEEVSRIPLKLRDNVDELIIPIEIKIGPNWRDLEDWKP